MRCLRWGFKFGMAAEVIRLAKSLEFTLVLNGYWETWANALGLAAQSAVGASDKAALGWVLHQNGTKALCDGNVAEARESLEQALQIREALRDKVGAEVTRHNLNLLVPLAVPPWKLWKLPVSLAAVTCALIAAVVFASKTPNLWHPPRIRALRATTTPTSATPSAATRSGPSGYPQRPISSSLPPAISLPAGPAPPEPLQTGIPPSFPPPGIVIWSEPPTPRSHGGTPSPTPRDHGGTPSPTPQDHGGTLRLRPGITVAHPPTPRDHGGTPRLRLGITVARLRLRLGITVARLRLRLGITVARPRLRLGITVARPRLRPGVTVARPRLRPAVTVARPRLRPAVTVAHPRLRPGVTVAVRPAQDCMVRLEAAKRKLRAQRKVPGRFLLLLSLTFARPHPASVSVHHSRAIGRRLLGIRP